MKSLRHALGALILAALVTPASAQPFGGAHSFNSGIRGIGAARILNPNRPLSAPAANPLQAQMQDNYATQLQAEQRDLLRQDPSGTTRQELQIGNQLNGFTPR